MSLIFFLVALLVKVRSHPQCLDYQPPFQSKTSLKFCNRYETYGCCTTTRDSDLEYDYEHVKRTLNLTDFLTCGAIFKEIVCLECHPYAAHIYDAERINNNVTFDKRTVNFPGLCYKDCINIFEKCKLLFMKITFRIDFREFISNSTTEEFCTWATIPDENYCYPMINSLESKNYTQLEHTLKLCVEPMYATFSNALFAIHADDLSHRLFVGEQRGLIYVIDNFGTKLHQEFLNITDRVVNSGSAWDERGLLGMAFHPQFKSNGRFFLYYSAHNENENRTNHSHYQWYWEVKHKIRISEFVIDKSNPNIADIDSELVLLEIDQPEANHNGGMLLFDSDGYLFIFVGDGGGSGDVHGDIGNGLNMTTLLGKVLRININSEDSLYSIPTDNPFVKYPDIPGEIYAYGIRNIWRCSLDKVTKRIFCGDVGQNMYEEINIIAKGANYGWRAYEGNSCFDEKLCKKHLSNLVHPIIVYNHSIGQSIVGGYVYRGCKSPSLYGRYFYADTMNGRIFSAKFNGTDWLTKEVKMFNSSFCMNTLSSEYNKNILSFGESESGELYILSTFYPRPNIQSSRLYRLVDPLKRSDPNACKLKEETVKQLKIIKRRRIYYRLNNIPFPSNVKCEDLRKYICTRYFQKRDQKAAFLTCSRFKKYTEEKCQKTCGYC